MTQDTPKSWGRQGSIPVELLRDADYHCRIPLSGAGNLTFPPDERYINEDGNPRRLEWLVNPDHIAALLGPSYNRPGRKPVFAIAQDLQKMEQKQGLIEQVLDVTNPVYEPALKALNEAVKSLRQRVDDLESAATIEPDVPETETPQPKKKRARRKSADQDE